MYCFLKKKSLIVVIFQPVKKKNFGEVIREETEFELQCVLIAINIHNFFLIAAAAADVKMYIYICLYFGNNSNFLEEK